MTPKASGGVWRFNTVPSYQITGILDRDQFNMGLSLNLERSSDEAVSAGREDPTLSLGWRRAMPTGDFGIAMLHEEASLRVTEFADTGLVGDGTRSSSSLSADWNSQLSDRLGVTLGTSYKDVSYQGGSNTDYATLAANASLSRIWSDRIETKLSLSSSRYVPDAGQSSTSLDTSFGLKLKLTERLDTDLRLGVNRTSGRSDNTGWTGGLALNYVTSERSAASFRLDRAVSDSGAGGFAESTQASGQLTYAISNLLSASVDVSWRENRSIPNTSTLQAGASLSRGLDDHWLLRMSYQYRYREQDGGDEADAHLLSLTLNYSHPELF
ncbi:MAG: hypothetical protein HXY26_09380 [Hydrogenophilaceae bacterium]|nr:hypothetical protein [Hydrogenophilaceae bacterium]